jgi:hypothetical protein
MKSVSLIANSILSKYKITRRYPVIPSALSKANAEIDAKIIIGLSQDGVFDYDELVREFSIRHEIKDFRSKNVDKMFVAGISV